MINKCNNCGKEIKEGDNFCSNCGNKINDVKIKNYKTYFKITGIIMFILSIFLFIVYGQEENSDFIFYNYGLPFLLLFLGSIIQLIGKKKAIFVTIAAMMYIFAGISNMYAINGISIFTIILFTIAGFNIYYSTKM